MAIVGTGYGGRRYDVFQFEKYNLEYFLSLIPLSKRKRIKKAAKNKLFISEERNRKQCRKDLRY